MFQIPTLAFPKLPEHDPRMSLPTNSLSNVQEFPPLPHHVHFIGICGKGMAALAICLQELGVKVTGSDHEPYGELLETLTTSGIRPNSSFSPEFLRGADCVIVSRNYNRGNAEIEEALEQRMRVYSMPQFISDFFLQGQRNLVVAGTKGKTTTTAMLARILSQSKPDVGFFVGGTLRENASSARFPGKLNVLEGDDYESAFWDPNPKFLYYRPETVVLTNMYIDHPEVHGGADGEVANFNRLVCQLPRSGRLIVGSRGEMTTRVAAAAPCPVHFVGFDAADDIRIEDWKQSGESSSFMLGGVKFHLPLIGRYNALNAAMAAAAAQHYGVPLERTAELLSSFAGVIGRQQHVGTANGIRVYTDLAYLPECLGPVLESFRERDPQSRIVLLYQPFIVNTIPGIEIPLAVAMRGSDLVLVSDVYTLKIGPMRNFEFSNTLHRQLETQGIACHRIGDLCDELSAIRDQLRPGDVLVAILHPRALSLMDDLVASLS
jgi:UDP-N-acetylmuramate: L-alanyl-gamma-D-glutamyl-meso-diaminopimelate ligase